ARYERHNSHHDCPDSDVKERSDSDKNQIDREQQHSNVFCDHAPVLSQADCLCTQKRGSCDAAYRRFTRSAARRICFSYCAFEGTRIASLMPCKNFLSAGAIVASAPRNFTRSVSTKKYGQRRTRAFITFTSPESGSQYLCSNRRPL